MPENIESSVATSEPKPVGIDAMMAQLDSAAAADTAVVSGDTPKPTAEAATATETIEPIAATTTGKPVTEVKPAKASAEEMSVDDMEKFLKAHSNKKPWKVYESLKTTTAQKVSDLEGKLSALEKKPFESPGDASKIALLEKQIESLSGETTSYKARLASADYIHTPKYEELRSKANRVWTKAVAIVGGMKVTDAEGTERLATKDDFDLIRTLPMAKRRQAAREMFGEDSSEVLGFVNQIDSIREENDEAQSEFSKNYEQNNLQREMQSKGQRQKFESAYTNSLEALKKNEVWGKWFVPDPADPEGSKLLADGFSEIEKALALQDKLSVEDSAAYSAVFRARAAAMPRLLLENKRMTTKLTALEDELKKYRGSDPGAKGATTGGGKTGETKPRGIDGAAMQFDSDPSLYNSR